jgi:hypothetical protein
MDEDVDFGIIDCNMAIERDDEIGKDERKR